MKLGFRYGVGAVILAVVVAAYFSGSVRWTQLVINGLWFALLGAAWNIQAGIAGVLGLGNALFIAVGAYTSIYFYNTYGISPWIGMWIGAGISMVIGVLVALPCLRAGLRGITYVFATFASSQILLFWLLDQRWLGGAGGIRLERIDHSPINFRFTTNEPYLLLISAMLAAVMFFTIFIQDRRWGLYMRAIRENEKSAAMSGIPVLRYQLIAVALSALFTSIAGSFYAQFQMSVSPSAVLSLTMALNTIIFTVVGGIGFVFGPVVGAFGLIALSEIALHLSGTSADFASIRMLIYGASIIAIALFLPGGLMSLFDPRRSKDES